MTRAQRFAGRAVALMSCAVALVAAAGSGGADSPRDERVKVVFLAQETSEGRERALGPTHTAGSATAIVETGSTRTFFLAIDGLGLDGAGEGLRCATSIGSLPPEGDPLGRRDVERSHAQVWWVRLRPMPAEVGEVVVEVEWERVEATGHGESAVVASDRATVSMGEGDRTFFDVVDYGDEAAGACRRNMMVGFSASVTEDPSLADAVLTYDLWLRHSRPGGDDVVRRFRGTGRQGEAVEFSLAPLRFPVPERSLADGSEIEIVMEILGSLRGRLRPDGSIDLNLSAARWSNPVRAGATSRGGTTAGHGAKTLTVAPGETVAIGLPAPDGAAGLSLAGSRVTTSGKLPEPAPGEVVVSYDDFFAGHADDLIVTVTRE